MQEIRSSNPSVVTKICDQNKSQARHHRRDLILILQLFKTHYQRAISWFCAFTISHACLEWSYTLCLKQTRDIWWFSESNGIQTHNHFVNEHLTIQLCWPVFLCNRVLLYKLNSCGFESHCNILLSIKTQLPILSLNITPE